METQQNNLHQMSMGRKMTTRELKKVAGGRDIKPVYEDECNIFGSGFCTEVGIPCLTIEYTPHQVGWYYTMGRCVNDYGLQTCHCEPYPS